MSFPLKILTKHLENERKWLGYEGIASADIKIKAGVDMAKTRVPELEAAIEVLKQMEPKTLKSPKPVKNQLELFGK